MSRAWKRVRPVSQILAGIAAALVASGVLSAAPPNVVILLADDLGYGDLGCYGATDNRTPHLDSLAAMGMRFTDFYVSQAVCTASRASLLTGCYAHRVGLTGALNHTSTAGISAEELLLPEICRDRGYATAIFGKWHLGHRPEFHPLRHGFDRFHGIPYSNDTSRYHPVIKDLPPLPLYDDERVVAEEPDQSLFTRQATDRAVAFIEEQARAGRPFFLYVPYVMPHVPIFASEAFRGRSGRGAYGDVVEELDASVGEIVAALDRAGVAGNTLVLFASDNGPFLSYGNHAGSAGPLREGKLTTFEGGVRVPGIAAWPGVIPAGRVCHDVVATIDILPTVTRLIGGRLPDRPLDGIDIAPLLRGEVERIEPPRTYRFSAGDRLEAVRRGRWKLHLPHEYLAVAGQPGRDGRPAAPAAPLPPSESGLRGVASRHGYEVRETGLALFDLDADPGETTDVAAAHPGVVADLRARAIAALPRPNILLIVTDDQRHDALGVVQREQGDRGRFPWLVTPRLDRLAAEGVRLRNAFVVTALCSPSRASILTGRHGHAVGIVDNFTPLPADAVTFASLLRDSGYTTAHVGKWHMGQQVERPGFNHVAGFVGQGSYFDCPFVIDGVATPTTGWVDDVSTDHAIAFMRRHRRQHSADGRPFALMLGYKTCHGDFRPPPRHAATFGEARARRVPSLAARAPYMEGARWEAQRAAADALPAAGDVPTNLGMFRGIAGIDDAVGRLLDTLDELGIADDTIVVFTSDNGYLLGEHGLGNKLAAYEESIRVPLIVRYPPRLPAGRVGDALALNIDIAPTLLGLAGMAPPAEMQGTSLEPVLAGPPPADWRTSFLYSFVAYTAGDPYPAPTMTAVRTTTAKLVRYPWNDRWTEVFDLEADPYETNNLTAEPAAAPLRARLEVEHERQAAAVGFVPRERSAAATPRPPNVVFIMADDLGWADVGFHGGRAPTPRLDGLASEGAELTAHHVAPVCSPTRAGLLTGRLWSRFGVTTPVNRRALPWDTLTLPRALQAAGYDTCLTGKWHLGSLPEEGPNQFGFDHSYGSLAGGVTPWLHLYKQGPWMKTWHRDGAPIEEPGHATDLITDEAVRWIESRGERPFFLYVPFTAVHLPVKEPEEWLARVPAEIAGDVPRHYAACIMHLDAAVGRILDTLEKTGRRGDTLVVFTSDNGGSTAENDDRSYPDDACPRGRLPGDNRPLRGEKGSVYEGGTRVPTVVAWPGVIPPGKVDTPTQIIDWMPTLCGLAGHVPAADAKWDGVDLTPLLLDRRPLPDRSLYTPGVQWRSRALRTGDWKLVVHGSDPDRRTELYDLATDPQEARDLAAREPQRVERMLAELTRLAAADNDARVEPPQAAGGRRPNIIVMLIDDLGYGDLGCFGCRDIPTPHIDALAAGGVRCTNAYVTNPPCSPSRASLITGMYAQRFGKSGMARGLPIPADHPTLAELLRDAGYVTGMIGKWDLGSWNQGPLDRGFMEVARKPAFQRHFFCLQPDGSEVFRTELEGDQMVEFVERHRDRPFFLYFAPMAVHSPSQHTPAHYSDRTTAAGERRPLAGAIVAVDDAVGKLRAALKRLGLEEETFIFFTSDNGPNLVEGGSPAPYRGGKGRGSQFEGWVRSPTIVSWPGRIPAGRTYDGLMGTIDAYATAAVAAGCAVPPRCDGVDLLPILERKQPHDAHEELYWLNADPEDEPHRRLRAMRWRQWRLVEYPEGWRLFDLAADPQETRDLAGDHPEVVADMRRRYDAWAGKFPPPDTSWTQDRRGGRMPEGWGWELAP